MSEPRRPSVEVQAVILAGGLGTRLRSVVADRPKVLAPVLGRPFLSCLFDQLQEAGIRRVVLCIGYRAELISRCYGATYRDMALRYSVEATPLGTGGALRHAMPLLDGGPLLVMNGDSYLEADLSAFIRQHAEQEARLSLLLAQVPDVGRYGCVTTDASGAVTGFVEKGAAIGSGWINGGIYLLDRDVVAAIPAGREVSLEREIFPTQIGNRFFGHRLGGRFIDIGTPESYQAAEGFFGRRTIHPSPFCGVEVRP